MLRTHTGCVMAQVEVLVWEIAFVVRRHAAKTDRMFHVAAQTKHAGNDAEKRCTPVPEPVIASLVLAQHQKVSSRFRHDCVVQFDRQPVQSLVRCHVLDVQIAPDNRFENHYRFKKTRDVLGHFFR